jgi:hypothetical protein
MTAGSSVAVAIVQDWQHELREKWQAITATHQVDGDKERSQLLADYHAKGYTQQAIGACIPMKNGRTMSQTYVDELLRYHRFITAVAVMIPERRFRAYWQQMRRDGRKLKGDLAAKAAEEQRIFAQIAAWVQDGKPPYQHPRRVERKPPKAPPRGTKRQQTQVRKEVQQIYRSEIQPEVKVLKALMTGDRREWAPTVIASRAERLDRGVRHLEETLQQYGIIETDEAEAL